MPALLRAPAPQPDGGDQLAVDDRRTATAAAVLPTILDHGPVARSTVARLTGLSAAAVSRHSTELAELGLIRERPVRRPRPAIGRPHVPVDIDTRSHLVGGIHIALRHTTLVLMDLRGRVLADAGDRMAAFADGHACGRRPLGVGPASGAVGTGLLPAAPFPDVLAALEADEPWALAPFGERARLVGRAVALLLDVINPEILVVAEAGDRAQARTARFARRGGGARTRGRRSAAHRGGEFVRNTNARRGGGIDRVARGICAPIETRAATCEHVIS